MTLQHTDFVTIFDQMTLFADEKVMSQIFTKQELKQIDMEVRRIKSNSTVRQHTQYSRDLLKSIGQQILQGSAS